MLAGSLPARPARPVADAPLAALTDVDALAKGWLLTLIAESPLASISGLPAGELAAEAPRLCGALVGALASEAELDRLRPGGDLAPLAARAGALAGAGDPAAAAAAVAALRASLWSALSDALTRPESELVSALAARLAHVCDVVAGAVLAAAAGSATRQQASGAEVPVEDPPGEPARLAPVPDLPFEPAVPVRPPLLTTDPAPLQPEPELELESELEAEPAPAVPADVFPTYTSGHENTREPWATAVMRRLSRVVAEGGPCAVLAVDVDDAGRLLAGDVRGEAAAALERAERAVRGELRPGDAAVREHDGRVWIVAAETGVDGARALARRLSAAVAATATLQGAPLIASIGIGVFPDDGTDPAEIVAHADEGVFAARAAGIPIA